MQHFKRILVPVSVSIALAFLLVGCPDSILGKWTTVSTGCLYPTDVNFGELVFHRDGRAEWYSPTEDEDEDGPYVFDWTRDGDEITMTILDSRVVDGVLIELTGEANFALVNSNSMTGTSHADLLINGAMGALDCDVELGGFKVQVQHREVL